MAREFELGGVVPWGRSASEYERFFALDPKSASHRILDCGGGPASFASEWIVQGHFVVAADPLYAYTSKHIDAGFGAVAERMLAGMRAARHRFRWEEYRGPEQVVEHRRRVLDTFLSDLTNSRRKGRYVAAALPNLPFGSDTFDLVLSSHLLFLYSDELGLQFHVEALREMLRVGREVRVFPLYALDGRPSALLKPARQALTDLADIDLVTVPFEFQRGATQMLRLRRRLRPGRHQR